MAFEGLQDKLKETWADLSSKIQESSAFNSLREKFESQPANVQKVILGAGALFAVLLVLYMPYSYLAESSQHMETFETNRTLITKLLRASRTSKEPSPLPPPMDSGSVRAMVERVLREKKLVPEQIGDMQAIPGNPGGNLVPAGVVQNGVAAQIKQLNVTQVLDIANTFQNLGPGTKLLGIDIVQTLGQTHYYDMIVRVVNFGIPAVADVGPDPAPSRPGRPGGGKRPPPSGGDDDE